MNIVWFNGPSARAFHHIPAQSLEIGCNFILNHRYVHHVCAYDQQCVDRIPLKDGVQYWTRRRCQNTQFNLVDSTIPYYDSGTLALVLANTLTAEPIYLLGCDWGQTNASVYDKLYVWRQHQPVKTTNEKFKVLRQVAQQQELYIVHETHQTEFGADIKWLGPKQFLAML